MINVVDYAFLINEAFLRVQRPLDQDGWKKEKLSTSLIMNFTTLANQIRGQDS